LCNFKVGDYVACNSNYYGITTKDRPCIVTRVYTNKIEVCCVGGDFGHDVLKNLFYKLNNFIPLKHGENVTYNDKAYKFERYTCSGVVLSDGFRSVTAPYDEVLKLCKGLFI
jgi:hypothetical protein